MTDTYPTPFDAPPDGERRTYEEIVAKLRTLRDSYDGTTFPAMHKRYVCEVMLLWLGED